MMLYLKQTFGNKWAPIKTTDFMLTEIRNDCRNLKIIGNKNINKKCTYGYNQFLFVYRLLLLKIIEILDCVLLNNKVPFIEPNKNIDFCYPFALFMYSDVGLGRKKFIVKQAIAETNFEEIPNLAGDPNTMINNWKEVRPKYLNYKGEIETLFAVNGYKEFHVPIRLKMFIEVIDEILKIQKSQYSPIKTNGIQLKSNTLSYNKQKIIFKKDGTRLKIISLLIRNNNGINSKDIRKKLEMNYDLFKTNIRQINKRIKSINLKIKYDKEKKLYLLTINY